MAAENYVSDSSVRHKKGSLPGYMPGDLPLHNLLDDDNSAPHNGNDGDNNVILLIIVTLMTITAWSRRVSLNAAGQPIHTSALHSCPVFAVFLFTATSRLLLPSVI